MRRPNGLAQQVAGVKCLVVVVTVLLSGVIAVGLVRGAHDSRAHLALLHGGNKAVLNDGHRLDPGMPESLTCFYDKPGMWTLTGGNDLARAFGLTYGRRGSRPEADGLTGSRGAAPAGR